MRQPNKREENKLYKKNFRLIAGVDEAGRGPLAGPIFAAAVIFKKGVKIKGINDSKKLTAEKRKEVCKQIKEESIAWAVAQVHHKTIDKIGIQIANERVILAAAKKLKTRPDYLLIDAIKIKSKIPSKSIIKGDEKVICIAAASILAKVSRDKYMEKSHRRFPNYKFNKHMGYGTKKHLEAIKKYGPSPLHRRSFYPLKVPL